jgi:hypothetical protein
MAHDTADSIRSRVLALALKIFVLGSIHFCFFAELERGRSIRHARAQKTSSSVGTSATSWDHAPMVRICWLLPLHGLEQGPARAGMLT